jgi:xylulose-5-phosphate/fructose-6-phosphate phosphoketolase
LSVGQIYLYDNPLLKQPLKLEHVKPRLRGHWGTKPGLNFLYVHLNRVIKKYGLNTIFIAGPGHGGPAMVANTYLEGNDGKFYPHISQDKAGMKRLFMQFSFLGGIPSHVAPETPGSIHEGGELGYALAHAYGAEFDNPDLLVACVVGDGEAETGPMATSWHSNKFLNPVHDGAVLPILHLNGYKIANPTVLARISHQELAELFRGYGYKPHFVEGDEPATMHQLMAATLDQVVQEIRHIQKDARANGFRQRPAWPTIILRSPKGWTGPKVVDGKPAEGSWRPHQVPLWELAELAPKGERRMGANLIANGGKLLRDLTLPDFRDYAVAVPSPGSVTGEATRVMGTFLRDVIKLNAEARNFRLVGPDETESNRLGACFQATDRVFTGEILKTNEHISPYG